MPCVDNFVKLYFRIGFNMGNGQMQGYRWLHLRAIHKGCVVSQNTVRQLIKMLDPEAVEQRRAQRLRRRQYHSKGPNALWHMGGYDKLNPYVIQLAYFTQLTG